MREGWVEIDLKSIAESIQYGYTEKSSNEPVGPRFLRITDIQNNSVNWDEVPYCKIDREKLKSYLLEKGDLLFARTGATVGKSFLIRKEIPESVFASYLIRVRVNNEVLNEKFLAQYFYSPFYWQQITEGQVGIGQPNVNGTKLGQLSIPIPPLPEQRAIVAKIEEIFANLDQGIADLKKAQEQLKVYRQAVLKKAFEGELTKEWREKQKDLPTADALIEKIRELRQKYYKSQIGKWSEELKIWEEKGCIGKRPSKPQKAKDFKQLTKDELENLPLIPQSWAWDKLGNVCLKIMDGTHFSPKNIANGDFKYITAKNIKEGRIDLGNISYVTQEDHNEIFSRCDVRKGDVLYIKDGATTGKAAVNTLEEAFSLLSSVGVFRTDHASVHPKFLEYFLNSQITRNRMLSNIAGVAITRLTLIKLNNSTIIVCPIEEQRQIVQEIESRLSVCDQVEQSITDSLEKAQALRQSILKKAFNGSLLTAEEVAKCKLEKDWEPADKLLERIKREKRK